jgi:mRNA interferase RelE/StbE
VKVGFEASFARDLKKIRDNSILNRVERVIANAKEAETLQNVRSLTKLRGYDTFYRIRIGDYRVGIEVVGDEVIFVRVLHRKNIYRYFP